MSEEIKRYCENKDCNKELTYQKRFCSYSCLHKMNASRKRTKHSEETKTKISLNNAIAWNYRKNKRIIKKINCETCNKEIETNYNQKFCSRSCQITNVNKNRIISEETRQKMKNAIMTRPDNFSIVSKLETEFFNRLEKKFNIKIQRQFRLDNKIYDGLFHNNLIELDGSYWHSFEHAKINDKLKDEIAKKNNFNIIRIKTTSVNEIDKQIEENLKLFESVFSGDENA